MQQNLTVKCLAEVTPKQLEDNKHLLTPTVYKRAKHVVEECERVRLAALAMERGDMVEFGRLLNASHKSMSELYEVTGRELDVLAYAAQAHPACAGSRMTGGGFGGCTVSLVKTNQVENFQRAVLEEYFKQTGFKALCYETEISDGIICEKI